MKRLLTIVLFATGLAGLGTASATTGSAGPCCNGADACAKQCSGPCDDCCCDDCCCDSACCAAAAAE